MLDMFFLWTDTSYAVNSGLNDAHRGFCFVHGILDVASRHRINPAQQPATKPIQQPEVTYFLVDASGSMKGENQVDAAHILRGLAASLPRGEKISVTYFGGKPKNPKADLCVEDVSPTEAMARDSKLPDFPELGGAADKTAIGRAIESVLNVSSEPVRVILITDGAEECAASFEDIRQQYPDAEILVRQVGGTPNPALGVLEEKPSKAKPSMPAPTPVPTLAASPIVAAPTPAPIGDEELQITFFSSLPWASLALLFAISFYLLGRSFAKAHRNLEIRLGKIDEDAASKSFVDFAKEKPRFIVAAGIFWIAVAASFVILWGTGDAISFARSGAASALNTEFGAAVFLAALMTLGAFAGSQYWRYAELRAKYGLASNEAERLKAARDDAARRRREAKDELEKTRLDSLFSDCHQNFLDRNFSFEKYLAPGDSLDANRELLETLVGMMKFLAAGPRPSREDISRASIESISRLSTPWAGKSPQALIDFIPVTRLPDKTRRMLRDFFYGDGHSLAAEQSISLQTLAKELELLVTQHSASP